MRISHRQLEAALRNPTQWSRMQGASQGYFQLGYDEVVRLAILRFHKLDDEAEARAHLEKTFARNSHKLKNETRKEEARESLASYIAWATANRLEVVEARVNLSFPTPSGIELSGRVTRVDVLPDGYRAVLLGHFDDTWEQEVRFPLLQAGVAYHYAVPVEDTRVGVQSIDGSDLRYRSFSLSERDEAMHSLSDLAAALGVQAS